MTNAAARPFNREIYPKRHSLLDYFRRRLDRPGQVRANRFLHAGDYCVPLRNFGSGGDYRLDFVFCTTPR